MVKGMELLGPRIFTKRRIVFVVVVVCVLAGANIAMFVAFTPDLSAEKALCEEFIRSNPEIAAAFGEVALKQAGYEITLSGDSVSGLFRYRVQGSRRSGQIEAVWKGSGTEGFKVIEVVEAVEFGEKSRLWPKGVM